VQGHCSSPGFNLAGDGKQNRSPGRIFLLVSLIRAGSAGELTQGWKIRYHRLEEGGGEGGESIINTGGLTYRYT
jgi:hypothetical protein